MRINKYLSESGYCSRRQADELIKQGKVFINGQKAGLGDQVDENDKVKVRAGAIHELPVHVDRNTSKVYLMYHKPVGIICTTDQNSKDNIIKAVNYPTRIYPVGRLDVASSGLIFLTNDGEFANQLTHPKFKQEKEYEVIVDELITPDFIKQLKQGINLEEGLAKADQFKQLNDHKFRIVIHQGWNRQIRRMCEAVGFKVLNLKRVRVGKIELGDLAVGKWRRLNEKELSLFKLS